MSSKKGAAPEALSEAAEWRLVGLLFERPRPGWLEEIETLSKEVASPALRRAALLAREATEGGYLSVLGPGGSVSPREVSCRPKDDPGRVLADLVAFYEAFAFSPETEDPFDHIAVEAGFAGYLRLKEAFAASQEDEEAREVTSGALERFLEDHLGPFASYFAGRLRGSGIGYLDGAASALEEMVARHRPPEGG